MSKKPIVTFDKNWPKVLILLLGLIYGLITIPMEIYDLVEYHKPISIPKVAIGAFFILIASLILTFSVKRHKKDDQE